MIRHLRHDALDKAAWDARLLRCGNRNWYAQSWVLDAACPGWEAIVDESADAMMPLTLRRKWGISYLYQPLGLQQLGVFAPTPDHALHKYFIASLPKEIRYIDILLNEGMRFPEDEIDGLISCQNQVLRSNGSIDELRAQYAKGHRRNLKDAAPLEETALSPVEFEDLFRRTTGKRYGPTAVKGLEAFILVIKEGIARGQCEIRALTAGGEPLAAICFAAWQGRSILLKSANTEAGQEAKAMFLLVDAWIARHAGSGVLLDFAGSKTASVARFNAGFGAEATTYFRLRQNRLPTPLRWLKR